MKEMMLHNFWRNYSSTNIAFFTTTGEKIAIYNTGIQNTNAGPDFLDARIKIGEIEWNGNIEIHTKSSDWIKHKHSTDKKYQNIILHVVYEHDQEIPLLVQNNIPTLELQSFVTLETFKKFQETSPTFTSYIDNLTSSFGELEKLYLQKLDSKKIEILELYSLLDKNWEHTTIALLAHTLGLKINATIFLETIKSISPNIIQKIRTNSLILEAVLLGQANYLDKNTDEYSRRLFNEYTFQKNKFNLPYTPLTLNFFRLRPYNFPSIRLSQLTDILNKNLNIFSSIIDAINYCDLKKILENISASEYWNNHFTLGKESKTINQKILSKDYIDIIILNCFLPIQYTYNQTIGKNNTSDIIYIAKRIPCERNTIIKNYKSLGIKCNNALDSQALLFLHKNNCDKEN